MIRRGCRMRSSLLGLLADRFVVCTQPFDLSDEVFHLLAGDCLLLWNFFELAMQVADVGLHLVDLALGSVEFCGAGGQVVSQHREMRRLFDRSLACLLVGVAI